jgi:quercetin dioxygenase-like cupin family protein
MHSTDEFFILLEGKIDFMTFDKNNIRKLQPGDTVYLARDIPHAVHLAKRCRKAKALVIYNETAD